MSGILATVNMALRRLSMSCNVLGEADHNAKELRYTYLTKEIRINKILLIFYHFILHT